MKLKYWYKRLAVFLALMLLFTGCSLPQEDSGKKNIPGQTQESVYVEESREEVLKTDGKAKSEQEKQTEYKKQQGITPQAMEEKMAQQSGLYYYDNMDESLHTLYAEILLILEKELENILISTNDSDVLQYVFQCVYCDHPEIYWIDGYSFTRYTQGKDVLYLTFSGKYIYTTSERTSFQFSINEYVSRCLVGIRQSASDYEKVKYIYEYIINHTDYVLDSKDNQTILSVFLYGESVCQGYAKAMQYLLTKLNVSSTLVIGKVSTGEGHCWNLVEIDGEYYYVDPTWGDASYQLEGSLSGQISRSIDYGYLNITTQQLLQNHEINSALDMPYCTAVTANYFVKENLYFTAFDEAHLQEVFENAYEEEEEAVTLKCSSFEVYQTMSFELLDNQYIFRLLEGMPEKVVYTLSDRDYTLTFWL